MGGHYDECRDGYCGVCGQTEGNCEHTQKKPLGAQNILPVPRERHICKNCEFFRKSPGGQGWESWCVHDPCENEVLWNQTCDKWMKLLTTNVNSIPSQSLTAKGTFISSYCAACSKYEVCKYRGHYESLAGSIEDLLIAQEVPLEVIGKVLFTVKLECLYKK